MKEEPTVAHNVSPGPLERSTTAAEPSVGALVQSAMADVSTLVRNEIELAKTEISTSAKKAGISVALFSVAGVLLAFAGSYFFISVAEFLAWLGLARWISFLIVTGGLVVLAALAALVGRRMLKKLEKPERTLETLRDLPEVMHREAPGERHRAVPTVSNGEVKLADHSSYKV
jgi:membrane protein implicated in regulation of membrane protease activity